MHSHESSEMLTLYSERFVLFRFQTSFHRIDSYESRRIYALFPSGYNTRLKLCVHHFTHLGYLRRCYWEIWLDFQGLQANSEASYFKKKNVFIKSDSDWFLFILHFAPHSTMKTCTALDNTRFKSQADGGGQLQNYRLKWNSTCSVLSTRKEK